MRGHVLKRRTKQRLEKMARGSVSVLLVIVLVPIVSVAGLFVDASRHQLARSEVAAAADLTLNTALADYDTVLKDVYGLFAVSQSDEELQNNLRSYFTDMIVNSGVATDSLDVESNLLLSNILDASTGKTSNLLAMNFIDDSNGKGGTNGGSSNNGEGDTSDESGGESGANQSLTFGGVPGSSLAKPDVLKNQIVEYNKYRTPVNAAFSILDGIKAISKTSKQMKVTQKQGEVDEAMKDLNEACKELYKAAKAYQDIDKSILSPADSVNGSSYRAHYENTIVPAAIQKVVVPDESDALASENSSKNSGYEVTCNTSEYTPTTEVATDGNGKKMSVGAATEKLNKEELEAECTVIAHIVEGNVALPTLDSANFTTLPLSEKQSYIKTFYGYMEDIYRLWRFYDAFVGKLPSDQRDEYKKGDGKKYADLLSDAVRRSNRLKQGLKDYKESFGDAESIVLAVHNDYVSKVNVLDDMSSKLGECISKVGDVKEKLGSVYSKNESFGSSINTYTSDGSDAFSAQMDSSYKSNKDILNSDNLEKFKVRLDSLKAYADQSREHYRSYKFLGEGLGSYSSLDDVADRFSHYSMDGGDSVRTYLDNNSTKLLSDLIGYVMRSFYSPGELHLIGVSIEEEPFYRYLKLTFAQDEESSGDENRLNNLKNTAETSASDASKTEGLSDDSISGILGDERPSNGGSDEGAESADASGMSKDGYSSMLSNMSSVVDEIVSGIGSVMNAARDNLFVMDYAFSMFSWYTQEKEYEKDESREDKAIKTPSGVAINSTNNKLYKAEVEYILYGKDTASANVATAMTYIFVIRFACNSIFALTNSEINSVTLAPALAIQAASAGVIPYKIPQVVMKLALALAESGVDMAKLNNGEAVPLLKDKFSLSPSGLVNEAKDAAIDLAGKAVDELGKEVKGSVNDLLDSVTDKATGTVEDLVGRVADAAQGQASQALDTLFGTFSTSIQLNVSRLTTSLSESATGAADRIVNEAVEAARTYVNQQDSGVARDALSNAFQTYIEGKSGEIKLAISGKISELQNAADGKANEIIKGAQDAIEKTISGWIGSAKENAISTVNKEVEKLNTNIKTKLSDGIDKASSDVKKGVADEINNWFDGNFGKYTGSMGGKTSSSKSVSSGFASLLKFKYSDYLKIFMYIKLCVDSSTYVTRIADLIELNIKTAPEDGDLKHAKGNAFSMSKAFTYYEMNASLGLETMFLDIPMITRRMGTESFSVFPLSYKGAQGY